MSSPRTGIAALCFCVAACGDAATAPSVDPGSGFAFASGLPDLSGPEIFVIAADGTGRRQLTTAPGVSTNPVWSPDARQIAFISNRDSTSGQPRRFQLYLMRADGTGVRRVTRPEDGIVEGGISWSPDGERIVYGCRGQGEDAERLCIVGTSGSGRRELLPPAWRGLQPAWSPEGNTITFTGGPTAQSYPLQVFAIDATGGAPRALTNELGHQQEPAWSSDGRLLILSTRSEPVAVGSEIVTMRADGTDRKRLYVDSFLQSYFAMPMWSRDGSRIAFGRADPHGGAYGPYRFYSANRDGSDIRPLPFLDGVNGGVSWGPE